MKKIFFIFFLFCFFKSNSQSISGYITDKETGEKLIGANFYDIHKKQGTVSNQHGFYSFSFKKASIYHLKVSYIGYQSDTFKINLTKDTIINFKIVQNVLLEEVLITAKRPIEERIEMSVIEIPMKQIKTLPVLAGEVDIMKAMQLMPGIRSGSEGQSSMFVRGGSHDQNLILLDDVPLYYVNHLGGFVSVFNPNAINSLKLYKGAFPARYGGRLSSIMDIRMKDGDMKKRQNTLTIGMISTKFQTEGPIKKDTSSYMISARRFMYDLITRPFTWLTNNKTSFGYTFYDLNAKLNYKFSDKNRLFFSFYIGNDAIITKRKEKINLMKNKTKWGNTLFALRWNHIFNPRFFSNITAYYTRYKYDADFTYLTEDKEEKEEVNYNFTSSINDICIKSDFEYFFPNYKLRFGSNHVFHVFSPNATFMEQKGTINMDTSLNTKKHHILENAVYIENQFTILKHISFNLGMRGMSYMTNDKVYNNIEPRLLLSINIPKLFSIKFSYSQMQQYVHLLSYSGASLPSDLWMPTTNKVPPQNSKLLIIGIAKSLFKNRLEMSIETYYKNMYDLIDYQDGIAYAGSNSKNWQELIETDGFGQSKGIEFLLQKTEGKINGWIAYTLSKTTRKFDNINGGNEYLYTYDAKHDFSITSNYYIKKNLYVSFSWIYTNGRAITFANENYSALRLEENMSELQDNPNVEEITITSHKDKNNIRMHPYHRLDIALNIKKYKKKSERVWNFSIYNLYNRQNPYFYTTEIEEIKDKNGQNTGNYKKKIYQVSLFPFIPSVSYTINF